MDQGTFNFLAVVTVAGCFIIVRLAIAFAKRLESRPSVIAPSDPAIGERFEALEGDVQRLQQELVETQERLDFAERILGNAREERRFGS